MENDIKSFLEKFYIILWKHARIRRKYWLLTIFEIITPTLIFLPAILLMQTPNDSKNSFANATYGTVLTTDDLYRKINLHDSKIFFAPWNKFTDEIVDRARRKLEIFNDGM